jgi:serine/threonine-protein kinase
VAEFQPGETLADRFEVVGTLGRGGTATVYLARDRVSGDNAAVKVLHAHLAHDPSMRRRLRREVTAAALVQHDGALVASELHDLGSTLALSMPFHAGTTLTERVRARGPLSDHEVRQLGARIAGALADAHRRGVLHRDVTPNNIMLEAASDAVLTDFGLARTESGTATATSVMGTPGYAAPEVYSGQRTEPRSDLYSLGATLYFAATGRSPFGSGTPAAVLQAQLVGDPMPVRDLRPDLAPDLVETIDALLQKTAARRPPSAQEVALALAAGRPALVPEVPDTWRPDEEPLLGSVRQPAPPMPVPVELPLGEWEVVVQGRSGSDPQELADNVARLHELPAGSIEITKPMRGRKKKKQFVLTRGTDHANARRLAEAARMAGYRARVYDVGPLSLFQRLVGMSAVLTPLVWIAFPFVTLPELGLKMALAVSITATILIPALTKPFQRRQPPKDLPVAFSGDLTRHLVRRGEAQEDDLDAFIDGIGMPDFLKEIAHEITADGDVRQFALKLRRGVQSKPAAHVAPSGSAPASPPPEAPPPLSRTEDLRGRALGNLDLFAASITSLSDTLPDLARVDLEQSVAALRERAVELSRTAAGLEVALSSTPEPADVSWVHGRLTRLETMERAGQSVDPAERERLRQALASADSAAAARDELESWLTATLAQLLEIGAVATRARADLLTMDDGPSARELEEQLRSQVDAVDKTRRELGVRRRAAGRRIAN